MNDGFTYKYVQKSATVEGAFFKRQRSATSSFGVVRLNGAPPSQSLTDTVPKGFTEISAMLKSCSNESEKQEFLLALDAIRVARSLQPEAERTRSQHYTHG